MMQQRYKEWALRVFCWDGLLPFAVLAIPTLAKFLFPRHDEVQVLLNVSVPIAAFFIRAAMADRQFEREEQYGWQGFIFVLAILFLVFVEAFLILFHSLDEKAAIEDWYLLGFMYLVYLVAMAVSLFPFRAETANVETELDSGSNDWRNIR